MPGAFASILIKADFTFILHKQLKTSQIQVLAFTKSLVSIVSQV